MRRPSLLVAFWLVMGVFVLTNLHIVVRLLVVVVASFRHREVVGEWSICQQMFVGAAK